MKLCYQEHMRELEYLKEKDPQQYKWELNWLKSDIRFNRQMICLWFLLGLVAVFMIVCVVFKIKNPVDVLPLETFENKNPCLLFVFLPIHVFWLILGPIFLDL